MNKETLQKANYINRKIRVLESYLNNVKVEVESLKTNPEEGGIDLDEFILKEIPVDAQISIGNEVIRLLEIELEKSRKKFTNL